jgi:hypothetical protein
MGDAVMTTDDAVVILTVVQGVASASPVVNLLMLILLLLYMVSIHLVNLYTIVISFKYHDDYDTFRFRGYVIYWYQHFQHSLHLYLFNVEMLNTQASHRDNT